MSLPESYIDATQGQKKGAIVRLMASEYDGGIEVNTQLRCPAMTPWGNYLSQLLNARRLSVRGFAERAGENHQNISAAMRGQPSVKGGPPRKPPLHKINEWAMLLDLNGEERDRFLELAHLEHSPAITRTKMARYSDQVAELKAIILALESQNAALRRESRT